jgi:hypothetical protein
MTDTYNITINNIYNDKYKKQTHIKTYIRFCKSCENIYTAKYKHSRKCNNCKSVRYNQYQ